MNYSVIFSSNSGNTKMLAKEIIKAMKNNNLNYFGPVIDKDFSSDVIFVGFWTNMGTCNKEIEEFLKTLKNKKIFLFGTAGMMNEEYKQHILNNVKTNIDSSNEVIGTFMCQGKMQDSVLERYNRMKLIEGESNKVNMLMANFMEAKKHPSAADLEALRNKLVNF